MFHAHGNQKRVWVAILIPDKINFKAEAATRDKEDHCVIVKGSIHQEDIKIINIYSPNIKVLNILNNY